VAEAAEVAEDQFEILLLLQFARQFRTSVLLMKDSQRLAKLYEDRLQPRDPIALLLHMLHRQEQRAAWAVVLVFLL
jgi:hypothetical protein